MTKSKHPPFGKEERSSDPMSSAFDRAFSKVAAELRGEETASLRSNLLRSAVLAKGTAESASVNLDEQHGCKFALVVTTANPEQAGVLRSPHFPQKFAEWRADPATATVAFVMMLAMTRPAPQIGKGALRRFFAYDSSFYPDTAVEDSSYNQKFWEEKIAVPAASMDFLKSGPVIWKTLGITGLEEETKRLLCLKSADAATSDAFQAALWSAYNTSRAPIDIATLAFGLATFVQAHHAFADLVNDEAYSKPYGEATVYGLPKVPGPNQLKGQTPQDHSRDARVNGDAAARAPRYLAMEADDVLRQQIETDPRINPEHLDTLDGLKLLLTSDAEKARVFLGTLGHEAQEILDDLLEVAIGEIEEEHATVVGIVNVLILRMLDIVVALRRNDLGEILARGT